MDRFLSLPAPILAAIATALLLEAAMFLILASERLRARIGDCCPPRQMAAWLLASALGPYLIYSAVTGTVGATQAALLIAMAGASAFWFVVIPRSGYADITFAVFMSAVILSGAMKRIYLPPAAKLPVEFLGDIMWARMMMAAVLLIRKMGGVNLGLWPNRREWAIGFRHYLYFLPIAALLNFALDFARPRTGLGDAGKIAASVALTFLAHFVFVALREELLFRGVMQQALTRVLANPAAALAITSIAVGLGHLPFRQFPNWKFAILAAAGHWFYGKAFQRAGGVRAAMVCHALVNTTWRVFLA